MSTLAQDVAVLERAQEQGLLRGRDLEVIRMQVGRAEDKLIKANQCSAFGSAVRNALASEQPPTP